MRIQERISLTREILKQMRIRKETTLQKQQIILIIALSVMGVNTPIKKT
jgi:hypothetical protein